MFHRNIYTPQVAAISIQERLREYGTMTDQIKASMVHNGSSAFLSPWQLSGMEF